MTQRELSREAKVSHTQISRYESNEATPRPGVLIRLATVLNTTLEFLRQGITEEMAVAELERTAGPLTAGEDVTFSEEEYQRLLTVSDITGLSLPKLTRIFLLIGIREDLKTNRERYAADGIDVDEHVSYYDEQLEGLGHPTLDSLKLLGSKKK